ncbi:MAG: response regulator [Deferribacterota bacterium]|nr:response regulator [Deferribacterota bacterium]
MVNINTSKESQIVEFIIEGKEKLYFGITINKVREIIKIPKITPIPDSHEAVLGSILYRNEIISIIDLPFYLGYKKDKKIDKNKAKIIVTYINRKLNGFLVDDITRIHRISLQNLGDYSSLPDLKLADVILGVVKIEDRLVQLLDFEKILLDINPQELEDISDSEKNSKDKLNNNKLIYIVEDSSTIRKIVSKKIEKSDYRVESFENAEQMLKIIDKKKPDLIISDLELPQINGFELIEIIKNNPSTKNLPIIIMTSIDTEENKKRALQAGASDFIGKTDLNFIVKKIEDVLQEVYR